MTQTSDAERAGRADSASGFMLEGGVTGCLFIHGFTSSPPEMRLLGEYLAERDITLSAPLLRGHGSDPAELNDCRWQDWIADCDTALDGLKTRCERVFVAGFSLGGVLTLRMAQEHPDLTGIIAYAPALVLHKQKLLPLLGLAKHFFGFIRKSGKSDLIDPEAAKLGWSYDVYPIWGVHELYKLQRTTLRNLSRIHQPALIFISVRDKHVEPSCGQIILEGISSSESELVTLHYSGHSVLIDAEYAEVFRRSYEFIKRHSPGVGCASVFPQAARTTESAYSTNAQ